ncbi:hypothetical protein KR059_012681 [Drosophila kikkawai]|nr:hypothetical protein KR059_012681 [Drosophila kikkawai]
MNEMKMMKLLMIFGFTFMFLMQPGLGNVLPFFSMNLINATEATAGGKATNGTTAAITITTTTPIVTTIKPMTTDKTTKKEQQTTTTTAPGKATTTAGPHKDLGYMGYMDSLFNLENSMRRKYQKRRAHGAPPTKAPLGGKIVAQPFMYYNMAPPRMEAARIDLELSYKPSHKMHELAKEVGDGNGGGVPSKHHKPTLPPLIEMLNKPQQHPDMPPIMEFLHGIVDLVINSSSSNVKGGNESKPVGYFNKTISPDGKHLLKEFGLLSPNMKIKGIQQETNYGIPLDQDTYEALQEVLGPAFKPIKMSKKGEQQQQHHQLKQQHFKELQHLKGLQKPKKQQHRREPQLGMYPDYELLPSGIDLALRKNYEMIDRLLDDLEQEDDLLQVIKDATKQITDQTIQLTNVLQKKNHQPTEELIVSCPIHHEFHADRFGDVVEEDVVDVGECEAVKIQD